jgi:hypothetical protein
MDPALQLALRASLALLLAAAAWHKLGDLGRFRAVVAAYDLLPSSSVVAAATVAALVEAALAASLVFGVGVRFAGPGAAALMLVYAAAIFVNVRRGRTDIDCGCMGPASRVPLGPLLVARNLVLAGAAVLLALPVSARPLVWFDAVSVLATTAAMAASWLAGERLLALAPRMDAVRGRPPVSRGAAA